MFKRIIIKCFLLIVVLGFGWVSHASALTIDLQISSPTIIEGDVFSIDVVATGVFDDPLYFGDEVLAFGFDIENSNSLVADLDSWTVGPLFDDDSMFFPGTDVAGSTFQGIMDDNILLATLNFSALTSGTTTLGISSDLFDFNEGLIYFLGGNVDISSSFELTVASEANPVPEPATMLLFATGMAGFAGIRIRRKKK